MLDKGLLGSGKDLDLTKKYFSNTLIKSERLENGTIQCECNIFSRVRNSRINLRIQPNHEKALLHSLFLLACAHLCFNVMTFTCLHLCNGVNYGNALPWNVIVYVREWPEPDIQYCKFMCIRMCMFTLNTSGIM